MPKISVGLAQEHVVALVDVFACTDGGVDLTNFRINYERVVTMALEGDTDMAACVTIIQDAVELVNALSHNSNRNQGVTYATYNSGNASDSCYSDR